MYRVWPHPLVSAVLYNTKYSFGLGDSRGINILWRFSLRDFDNPALSGNTQKVYISLESPYLKGLLQAGSVARHLNDRKQQSMAWADAGRVGSDSEIWLTKLLIIKRPRETEILPSETTMFCIASACF